MQMSADGGKRYLRRRVRFLERRRWMRDACAWKREK